MGISFDNTYARLPEGLFSRLQATPVKSARWIAQNTQLAMDLDLNLDWFRSDAALQSFAGNATPKGAEPLAQLYAGHQFGQWNPQLGDGRALLLGEVIDVDGNRRDIQLKGSGRTPYSRGGDGRAWLGPVLREYIVSEAMHALGVPTTRALAAVTTGEQVHRESPLPGAVLTRVAASHIRVGTFQVLAARGESDLLRALFDYVVARHYAEAESPIELLQAVVRRQADLIAKWMTLGFIHGVMNTDNCAISGETIDYGPCAFMDAYHPACVFSSIDQLGRYAYSNQPSIAAWNLAQFATALLPLTQDSQAAIDPFTAAVNGFGPIFQEKWLNGFAAKLGISDPTEADAHLIQDLLSMMSDVEADFTMTFTTLAKDDLQFDHPDRSKWFERWRGRRNDDFALIMRQTNPAVIPRNHRVENVIQLALEGDLAPFNQMLAAVTKPFARNPDYERPPSKSEEIKATFCGT